MRFSACLTSVHRLARLGLTLTPYAARTCCHPLQLERYKEKYVGLDSVLSHKIVNPR